MIYVAVLGPPLCGKRTFINKGLGNETNFSILKDQKQVEIYEYKKKFNYVNGKNYDIEFSVFPYSKSGKYEFNNKTDFFIIIFDIGNEDSFHKSKEILDIPNIQDNIISFNEKKSLMKKDWEQLAFVGLSFYLIVFIIVTYNYVTIAFFVWCFVSSRKTVIKEKGGGY